MTSCKYPPYAAKHPEQCHPHPSTTTTVPATTSTVPQTTAPTTTVASTTTTVPAKIMTQTTVSVPVHHYHGPLPATGGSATPYEVAVGTAALLLGTALIAAARHFKREASS